VFPALHVTGKVQDDEELPGETLAEMRATGDPVKSTSSLPS
jgi:hypothetical protein